MTARGYLAGALCLAFLAGCTSTPTVEPAPVESATQSGAPAAMAVAPASAAGPVPASDASGPAIPSTFPPSVLSGSGLAVSVTPVLQAPDSLSGESVRFEIYDVSAGAEPGEDEPLVSTTDRRTWQVPSGVLVDGRQYAWRAQGVNEGGDEWAGPFVVDVDTVRPGLAPRDAIGGVSTHLVTGVPTLTWSSRSFPTVASRAFALLTYSPTQSAGPGLPPGWRMSIPLASRWTTFQPSKDIVEGEPASVYIADVTGRSMTFSRNEFGVYAQTWSNGRRMDAASSGTLERTPRGWQLTEANGDITAFEADNPVAFYQSGLLTGRVEWSRPGAPSAVVDPSERRIAFSYGSDCSVADGFAQTPDGMLCGISWWDGTQTAIHYVSAGDGAQIGLIVDSIADDPAAESGLGLGWDASGRIASIRQPMVNAAVAAGVVERSATDILTQIAYDANGRVSGVAEGAASPGGPRLVHTYEYAPISDEDARRDSAVSAAVTAGVLTGDFGAGIRAEPIPSQLSGNQFFSMEVSARDWRPLARLDRDGARTSMTWDESGRRVESITDYEGRTTDYSYDGGRRSGFTGPSTGGDGAFSQETQTDRDANDDPYRGLAVDYWASGDLSGTLGAGGWIGRDGGVQHTWASSPLGDGAWSARLTGTWTTKEGGDRADWAIDIDVAGAKAMLYVDNRPCEVNSRGVCQLSLRKGTHALRIDLSEASGETELRVGAALVGDEETPEKLPLMIDVAPGFGVSTATRTNDVINDRAEFDTLTSYAEPWTGLPTAVESPGRRVSTATYESVGSGGWGRKLTSTTPGGATTSTSYWPVTGGPEASPCPAAVAAVQAGQVRSIVRSDGVVVERWFDAAGRTTAVRTGSGDDAELACWTFAADGTLRTSRLISSSGKVVEEATFAVGIDGDPRRTRTSVRSASEGGLIPGEMVTESQVDLLGRLVSYRDLTGALFEYEYDVLGNQITRRTSVNGSTVVTVEQEFDSRTGRPSRMMIDGEEIASIEYRRDGRVARVLYASGVEQSYSYRANGTVDIAEISLADGTRVVDSTSTNAAGRVRVRSTEVRGAGDQDTERRWGFEYDDAARLSRASLEVMGDRSGVGVKERRFDYDFGPVDSSCKDTGGDPGADLNRTGGRRDDRAYVTCYDNRGRVASTTDPLMAPNGGTASLDWDGIGRLVSSAAEGSSLELEWAWGGMPSRIVDGMGTLPVTTELAYGLSRIIAQRSQDDSTSVVTRMAYANPTAIAPGLLLDEAGRPMQVRLLLPGGALWKRTLDTGAVVIDHPGIRGEVVVRSDGSGTAVPGPGGGILAETLGPFGEPVEDRRASASAIQADPPAYGYGFARLESTAPGGSGLVLSVARPYLPALGAYLAFDPVPGSSSTGYGFAEADPVNFSDPTGAYSWFDFARNVLAVASITASIMLPGSFAIVLAVSLLSSAAQLSVTAWERGGYDELTTTDVVFEAISVGLDLATWGAAKYKGWGEAAKVTKPVLEKSDELASSAVRASTQAANEQPSLFKAVAQATLTVAGFQILLGGGGQPQQMAGPTDAQEGDVEPQDCPVEGGCEGMPSREGDHRVADRL